MESLTPAEIASYYSDAGVKKTTRATSLTIINGMMAGAIIALASATTNTASFGIHDVWTAKTICGLLFPFGLAIVLILGTELFTGNCLISITLLEKRCTMPRMLRNWVVVYCANLLGALVIAAGCAWFGQLNYGDGALAVYTMKVAIGKSTLPFQNGLVMGFLCNFLVCMGLLVSTSAKDTTGRILGAFLPVCYFITCGFEHCVANMYYIPAGLMAKAVPAYAQLAVEAGLDLSKLTLSNFLVGNLLPVTLGNTLGGLLLGWVMWFCYLKKR